jgi:hypothetical protein
MKRYKVTIENVIRANARLIAYDRRLEEEILAKNGLRPRSERRPPLPSLKQLEEAGRHALEQLRKTWKPIHSSSTEQK